MAATPRRRLIRSAVAIDQTNHDRQRQMQKYRERLTHERTALARWQTRLKRAFNAVEKAQKRIARIERQLTNLEEQPCRGPANGRSQSSPRA
jgi:septal ring factor EnvC (AmiA/AmiB activator)